MGSILGVLLVAVAVTLGCGALLKSEGKITSISGWLSGLFGGPNGLVLTKWLADLLRRITGR